MTTEPILQTDKLSLRFKDKQALDQLSLSVARGRQVSIADWSRPVKQPKG